MNKLFTHIPYWVLLVIAGFIALHFHDQNVAARALLKQRTDSLAFEKAKLDSATAIKLRKIYEDSLALAAKEAEIKVKEKAVTIFHDNYHKLADSLVVMDSTYKIILGSIVDQADSALAIEQARTDSALVLFHNEQKTTATLKESLADYQKQNVKLLSELKLSQKKSILDSKPVQIATKLLAVKGFIDVVQGK